MTRDNLRKEFRDRYQKDPEHIFFCPGRVNLIGEHIDYNGGQVMPFAISLGTYLAVAKNTSKTFRFESLNFPEKATLHLQSSYSKSGKEWFNYPLGVINQLLGEGHDLSGLDLLFDGDLPVGAGLSSSASVEVVTAFALNKIFNLGLTLKEIALLCQQAENGFMGVSCGIMDQYAVALGEKDKALLLNCDTVTHECFPFETGHYLVVIINTNKKRTLSDSKYNERFNECGAALTLLKKELPLNSLCEAVPSSFESMRYLLNNAVLEKRTEHVIHENARVKDAAKALQRGDIELLGELMYASHHSLKELYEVTGPELDAIVDFCKGYEGCIGARMTGAGFGGCAIALVHHQYYDDFVKKITAHYESHIGYKPTVMSAGIDAGVREV